jgi:hypothetical protein
MADNVWAADRCFKWNGIDVGALPSHGDLKGAAIAVYSGLHACVHAPAMVTGIGSLKASGCDREQDGCPAPQRWQPLGPQPC